MGWISLATAITLTKWSERTFWRRFADGSFERRIENGRSMVDLCAVQPHSCIPIDEDTVSVIEEADGGCAAAQNTLALIFLSHGKPREAVYWLDLAARQNHADAMHWLGRCHIEGNGVPPDENLGIMWLSNSAAHGHVISCAQMQTMRDRFTGQGCEG